MSIEQLQTPSTPRAIVPVSSFIASPDTSGPDVTTRTSIDRSLEPTLAAPLARWTGWTWLPTVSAPQSLPVTPKRATLAAVPKSSLRRRPVEAYKEMVTCIGLSAQRASVSHNDVKCIAGIQARHRVMVERLQVSCYPRKKELTMR